MGERLEVYETALTGLRSEVPLIPVSKEFLRTDSSDPSRTVLVRKRLGVEIYHEEETVVLKQLALFKPTKNADRDRQIEAGILYSMFLDNDVIDGLEQDYGFPIRELTTREQLWFVNSLKGYTADQEKPVSAFTQRFGLDGARAFLSCEYGDDFRDVIETSAKLHLFIPCLSGLKCGKI
ncbi:MAG: hypothetical protein V1664_01125 [Candidatus Uhrbacteria bacterium]